MGLESFFGMATTMNYSHSQSSNNFSHEARNRRWLSSNSEEHKIHAIHKFTEKIEESSTDKIITEIVDDIPEDISFLTR